MNGSAKTLGGARVLILEDDYYLATDLQDALEEAGAIVVGPFPDEAAAKDALAADAPQCALVDVNLGGGPSFALPRELMGRGIPFAFVTGYDADVIPSEFGAAERLEKPIVAHRLLGVLLRLLGRAEATSP